MKDDPDDVIPTKERDPIYKIRVEYNGAIATWNDTDPHLIVVNTKRGGRVTYGFTQKCAPTAIMQKMDDLLKQLDESTLI